MALTTCPDCGKPISIHAIFCPNCGRPMKHELVGNASGIIDSDEIAEGERIVCLDETCTGIIGTNGKCGTCGKYTWKDEDKEGWERNITGTRSSGRIAMTDPNKPVKHSNYISGFLALCLFVVLPLFCIGHCMFAPEKQLTPEEIAAQQERSDEFDAREWAEVYVRNSLKAPTTADFQNQLDFAVKHLKGGKDNPEKDLWKVSGYVDAQNSFGAMIRNRFYTELVKVDDKWIPVKIVVGE